MTTGDDLRELLAKLLMQPYWNTNTGFAWGRSDASAIVAEQAINQGLIEPYSTVGANLVEYRVTKKGKEFLNGP